MQKESLPTDIKINNFGNSIVDLEPIRKVVYSIYDTIDLLGKAKCLYSLYITRLV